MKSVSALSLFCVAIVASVLCSPAWAQQAPQKIAEEPARGAVADQPAAQFDKAFKDEGKWYFSWGYSRQQYAPSDIHVSQPTQGNDFTLHQVKASDFPGSVGEAVNSLIKLDLTSPQENVRIGYFLNPGKTFAIEFNLDHSKYNTDVGQSVRVSGTVNNAPATSPMVLGLPAFDYALHNGLNHLMVNAVWFHHLHGPKQEAGELQLISRLGAGLLLPHADNTIFGNPNEVGAKGDRVCCFDSRDWWQVNGWTAGAEVGVRYRVYKSIYLEATQKFAYGVLRGVPVYRGTADHSVWMSEQVFSTGFLF
jgi:opacity protein-like surface antigen